MKWEDKSFYQTVYTLTSDDLMGIWIETFHSFGAVLVIWDAATHFDLLNRCGILVNPLEAYNNKVITVELPGIMDAFEVMDAIKAEGAHPFMQAYNDGKLISDAIGPSY